MGNKYKGNCPECGTPCEREHEVEKIYYTPLPDPYIGSLEAARRAYASEFPNDENGEPDVGSIHANIRRLKSILQALALCADRASSGDPSAIPAMRHHVLEARKMGLIP